MTPLEQLTRWYAEQCDGDWEHVHGITISTLDNPGWQVRLDLAETELEGKCLPRRAIENADGTWLGFSSDGLTFSGACDPLSLDLLLLQFMEFSGKA